MKRVYSAKGKFNNDIPRTFDEVNKKMTDMSNEFTTKRNHINTLSNDVVIPLEIHNQAGQNGVDISSEVTHHYTDATAKVIDNVGDGTILMLSNSQNAVMRPDKASDYVGNGNVLKYRKYNNSLLGYEDILIIDPNGNITRQKIDQAFSLVSSKLTDNGLPGFTFDSNVAQTIAFNFRNGGSFLTFNDEVSKTKACIVSNPAKTVGLELRADAGSLFLKAPSGSVQMYFGSAYYPVQPIISCTTVNRPTTNLVAGFHVFDTTLNKPIWRNTANTGWVDATGATV